jgi:dihydrodiol dehydrogenase / D-xylose 1-dehydrogenase (NADP)
MTTFRWGILGTGAIATQFTEGLKVAEGHVAAAVGSRTQASADAFAGRHGIERAFGTYADLAADDELDAVYVATPHSRHLEDSLLCIGAGTPVLCEKPLALSEAQGRRMVEAAREQGVFLMEAMWTRFNPVMGALRAMLAEGTLGEPRQLFADFGFRTEFDAAGRHFDPALGGGALLDVGVYCIALGRMVFGADPEALTGLATLGETGVDEQCVMSMRYPGGGLAMLSSAVRTETPQEAVLSCTGGRVRIPSFWCPDRLIIDDEEHLFDIAGNGYHYQALEVAERVRAGEVESPLLPHEESLAVLRTMDTLRGEWGVRYPGE